MRGLFDDDMFNITTPEGLVVAAGSGLLDDGDNCACWCGCQRAVEWPDDECDACRHDRHRDASDPDDRR